MQLPSAGNGSFGFPASRYIGKRTLKCRNVELALGGRTLIMGILNVTPDSFSDGGNFNSVGKAVERAFTMVEEGADIIDIGGESTRPGFAQVSPQEESDRVIPVIRALTEAGLTVPISIDTYKPEVARGALEAGAHILNDIWGLKHDLEMARLAAEYDCPVIVMHNRPEPVYDHFETDVVADLMESISIAQSAGVRDEQIVLDPGIGFGKTYEHNLQLMNRLHLITALGFPVLLGTSRKSMIQKTLGVPAADALEGTAATVALGAAQGCAIMRVHDVKAMKRVALMTDAMIIR
ncbi:dihydropteroate synthase [Paenibacillus sp. IB182363]|uniref:Dihydropteroate synthase n=2 Tax=Paenibacillus oceani TaxID=2772510 RepID=A0A927CEE9_9BACL|nr:dihydropteroate synthase [Paenibacillus oceani]